VERPILRQYSDLTARDFDEHPVWVNCHVVDYDAEWDDDTDEETFRPEIGLRPVDPRHAMYLVRAQIVLADGTAFPGFLTPQEPARDELHAHPGTTQPTVFLPSGEVVPFWFGVVLQTSSLAHFYQALGRAPEQIFPLTYAALPGLTLGTAEGRLDGFCGYSDFKMHTVIYRR
jgi:hypothetical protein